MNVLVIINGAAYGSELPFNGLRLAGAVEEKQFVEGAVRSSMEELADWTLEADRIVTF